MSEADTKRFDEMLARVGNLITFAKVIGVALFLLGAWVTKQEFTDNAQNEVLLRHEQELATRGDWMKRVEERLTRMEERQENIRQDTSEIKEILRQRN